MHLTTDNKHNMEKQSGNNNSGGNSGVNTHSHSGSNWKLIFGIVMVFIYLAMAGLLMFSDFFHIPNPYRIIIGALFGIYGLFRGYRIWKQ